MSPNDVLSVRQSLELRVRMWVCDREKSSKLLFSFFSNHDDFFFFILSDSTCWCIIIRSSNEGGVVFCKFHLTYTRLRRRRLVFPLREPLTRGRSPGWASGHTATPVLPKTHPSTGWTLNKGGKTTKPCHARLLAALTLFRGKDILSKHCQKFVFPFSSILRRSAKDHTLIITKCRLRKEKKLQIIQSSRFFIFSFWIEIFLMTSAKMSSQWNYPEISINELSIIKDPNSFRYSSVLNRFDPVVTDFCSINITFSVSSVKALDFWRFFSVPSPISKSCCRIIYTRKRDIRW